jgi:hypothetical protein
MHEPGGVHDLDEDGRAAWSAVVDGCVRGALELCGPDSHLSSADSREASDVSIAEWIGLPSRVVACIGRHHALELLDWRGDAWDSGRQFLQEEYLEWRVVRDDRGGVRRVEFTTEFADYWRILASFSPVRTLELVAEFAGVVEVPVEAVYGALNPLLAEVTPQQREDAFAATMLPPEGRSQYNTGERAICCMVQPTNTLFGVAALIAAGAVPRSVDVSGGPRPPTAAEAIPLMGDAAQFGRESDPVIVERVGRLAFNECRVGLDDPVGVYIQDIEHSRLRVPGGESVPREWFRFERGIDALEADDGRARFQRLVLEIPSECGLRVTDLVDIATEEPIGFGGQLAELVSLGVLLRASAPGTLTDPPSSIAPVAGVVAPHCEDVHDRYHEFSSRGEFSAPA